MDRWVSTYLKARRDAPWIYLYTKHRYLKFSGFFGMNHYKIVRENKDFYLLECHKYVVDEEFNPGMKFTRLNQRMWVPKKQEREYTIV